MPFDTHRRKRVKSGPFFALPVDERGRSSVMIAFLSVQKFHEAMKSVQYCIQLDASGHEINFFGKEPSGSQIFQSGCQGQKVRSH